MPRSPVTLGVLDRTTGVGRLPALQWGPHVRAGSIFPASYGRVVASIDRILAAINREAVLGGGWAVWHHGYVGGVTQDIDIALPAGAHRRVPRGSRGFGIRRSSIRPKAGGRSWSTGKPMCRWTSSRRARRRGCGAGLRRRRFPIRPRWGPTDINCGTWIFPHYRTRACRRATSRRKRRGEPSVPNMSRVDEVREHLSAVHPDYLAAFNRLVERVPNRNPNDEPLRSPRKNSFGHGRQRRAGAGNGQGAGRRGRTSWWWGATPTRTTPPWLLRRDFPAVKSMAVSGRHQGGPGRRRGPQGGRVVRRAEHPRQQRRHEHRKNPQDYTLAEWNEIISTNLTSAFLFSPAARPEFKRVAAAR